MKQVVFHGPNHASLDEISVDESPLAPSEIAIESRASLISQGTEGAAFQGLLMPGGKDQRYPQRPGYANVGVVTDAGVDAPFSVGDTVFSMTNHASHNRIDTATTFAVKVPDGLDPNVAVFTRLAMVSMSTLRTSTARLGDRVGVVGLGMVGNLAAQQAQIGGMQVTAVDLIPWRCDLARQCGIETVLEAPAPEDLKPIHQLVIEATGTTGGARTGMKLTQRHGELSLVGSQWGAGTQTTDFLRVLGDIFEQYIHIRSGWEWQLPILPTAFGPSSLTHNAQAILHWLSTGKLRTEPLLSHVVKPDQPNDVYAAMVTKKDAYLGVVFDWTS
jgi:2-desacetyl-2-hydroxyethyl bacteriochlorophyllide A dehydrogenase